MKFENSSTVEEWKPVLGYEGLYDVSNMGRVRANFKAGNFHKPGRILKPWILKNGYVQVRLFKNGVGKGKCIHTLILESFVGPAPINHEVRHLNGVRHDNSPSNLKWGTHKENAEDMRVHGTMLIGEKAPACKLRECDVIKIREMSNSGISHTSIASLFLIDKSNVGYIVNRKTWRHI